MDVDEMTDSLFKAVINHAVSDVLGQTALGFPLNLLSFDSENRVGILMTDRRYDLA